MSLHHRLEGDGATVLVLGGSLGSTLSMWEPQLPSLGRRFRTLRYDHPGHGGSPVDEHVRSIEDIGRRVLALLDELVLERIDYCGLSLGGMVGMWLAAHAPDRVGRLVLCCTAPELGPPEGWLERAAAVRRDGVASVADAVVGRWFTNAFHAAQPGTVARHRAMLAATPAEGYARCCEAIAGLDLRGALPRIVAPTLVVTGADDPVVDPERTRALTDGIPGAYHVELAGAAHLANVEQAKAFDTAILEHLEAA